MAFKNLGWSRYRDADPVPTSPLADVIAKAIVNVHIQNKLSVGLSVHDSRLVVSSNPVRGL